MRRYLELVIAMFLLGPTAFAFSDNNASTADGTIQKVNAAAKVMVVKTADGTEHTFHFLESTAVHGAQDLPRGVKSGVGDLKEGASVVVHYTSKGSEETADEVDLVGKDGLKSTEGTVSHIDRGAKTIAIKTADGVVRTYRLTERATVDSGKELGKGSERGGKVAVYYSEESGHKIAHFIKKL